VIGFGFGLGLGVLLASPTNLPGEIAGVTEPTVSSPVATAEEPADSGISGLVPDFPDALVGVGDSVGSGHDYLLWPVSGDLVVRSMTGGGGISLDSSGQYVALSEQVPGLKGLLLSMGRFNGIRHVTSGVTSYAWHDAEAGALAFTTEENGEWHLLRVRGGFSPSPVVSGTVPGGSVAAWGDWGFAIQAPDDRVVLLTADGEPKDIEPGTALAAHESGWILVEEDGLKLVSSGGGVRRLQIPDLGGVLAAAFSPDGSRVAVAGRLDVAVIDLSGDEVVTIPGYPGNWVSWSSDSRFVIGPARSGLHVNDLETGESYQVLIGRSMVAAQVLPLSTS
jgi:hypothetical protein